MSIIIFFHRDVDVLPQKVKVIDMTKSLIKCVDKFSTKFSYRVKPQNIIVPVFLHDIKQLPVYTQPNKLLTTQECVTVLFGTDGELALESALSATFANAQHVRCFLHF